MVNEQEIERMKEIIRSNNERMFMYHDGYINTPYDIAKYLSEEGIGDKRQAVKKFMERALSKCEAKAVYAEWRDKHGEYGGDMVSISAIEIIFEELFTELCGEVNLNE